MLYSKIIGIRIHLIWVIIFGLKLGQSDFACGLDTIPILKKVG